MLAYATEQDLTAWMAPDPVPANAGALLRSASGLVRSQTKLARYDADNGGYPTDTGLKTAFRDATTAQAAYWDSLGIDPTKGLAGEAPAAVSKSIGAASITYAPNEAATAARAAAYTDLSPDAWYILNGAGLLGGQVMVR